MSKQTYSLAEIRNGTGWSKGLRFAIVEDKPDPIRVVVEMDGGLVEVIYSSVPNVEVMVQDFDTEGGDAENIVRPARECPEYYAICQEVVVDTEHVNEVYAEVTAHFAKQEGT